MKRQKFFPQLSRAWWVIALAGICFSLTAEGSAQTTNADTKNGKGAIATEAPQPAGPSIFDGMVRNFQESYRLGPADEIAIRIKGQSEYSIEKTKVTPTGTVYHVLLGDVLVAGLTIDQAKERLTKDLSEYLKDPIVSISLIEAVSAKFSVIGDVIHSGIFVMSRPMTIVDAITTAGGFAPSGSRSSVDLVRPSADGTMKPIRINVKNILEGKAKAEENVALLPGDVVIVHGNLTKKLGTITALAGFGSFTSFMTIGKR